MKSSHCNSFAPVAPIQVLEGLLSISPTTFGRYHLLLAHHTVEHPARFTELFRVASTRIGQHIDVIMDNSLVELGGAVDSKMIREAVEIVQEGGGSHTHVIPVLPDVMGDAAATIQASTEAYSEWQKDEMPGSGYMVVAQGPSFWDFIKLIDHFFVLNYFPEIRWVGIPRALVSTLASRRFAIEYVQTVAPHVQIHLLGFSDNVLDDLQCARLRGVRGIDSAVPLRHDGIFLPTSQTPPRSPDWFDKAEVNNDTMLINLYNIRKWVENRAG